MEPTGIEPVTSCLQIGTADQLDRLVFRRLREIRARARRRGYGGIRLGLGSRTGLLPNRQKPLPQAGPVRHHYPSSSWATAWCPIVVVLAFGAMIPRVVKSRDVDRPSRIA
jgi:hypothetical protein